MPSFTPGFGSNLQLTVPPAGPLPGGNDAWNAYRNSLRDSAIRDWQQSLDAALKGVEQHYASRGLGTSGLREGAIGQTAQQTANAMGGALLGIDQRVLGWMLEQAEREKAYQREQERYNREQTLREKQIADWNAYQERMMAQQRMYEGSMADRMAMQNAFGGSGGYLGGADRLAEESGKFRNFFDSQRLPWERGYSAPSSSSESTPRKFPGAVLGFFEDGDYYPGVAGGGWRD